MAPTELPSDPGADEPAPRARPRLALYGSTPVRLVSPSSGFRIWTIRRGPARRRSVVNRDGLGPGVYRRAGVLGARTPYYTLG